jgi:hypothetical protein
MSTRDHAPPVGEVLGGRYRLAELIGRGGMADVYAAHDVLLDRDVAVKLSCQPDDRAVGRRFTDEVRMLAGLSHPALVSVFDGWLTDERPYLVMRLVRGGTLCERIDDGPLDPGVVAGIGARLADALSYVHGHGIVHRDVKPSNVLIDQSGEAYLADFGLAWLRGSAHLTDPGQVMGTACYLAPEQVRGEETGAAADVYALGLVLLECLTGRAEYTGPDIEAAVARLYRRPLMPEGLDHDWHELLTAMTAHHPAERPDAAACAERLRGVRHAGGVPAPRGPGDLPTYGRLKPTISAYAHLPNPMRPPMRPGRHDRLAHRRISRQGAILVGLGGAATAAAVWAVLFTGGAAPAPGQQPAPAQPATGTTGPNTGPGTGPGTDAPVRQPHTPPPVHRSPNAPPAARPANPRPTNAGGHPGGDADRNGDNAGGQQEQGNTGNDTVNDKGGNGRGRGNVSHDPHGHGHDGDGNNGHGSSKDNGTGHTNDQSHGH